MTRPTKSFVKEAREWVAIAGNTPSVPVHLMRQLLGEIDKLSKQSDLVDELAAACEAFVKYDSGDDSKSDVVMMMEYAEAKEKIYAALAKVPKKGKR